MSIYYGPGGSIIGLTFDIAVPNNLLSFKLPVQAESVFRVLSGQWKRDLWDTRAKADREAKTRAQAERVAWRILKDWVAAQLALIEVGMVTLDQVFLPYVITPTGQTLYERLKGTAFLMLKEGGI